MVVVHDGINDTKMNNVPPARFQEDYGQVPWYQIVNAPDST